MNNNKGFTLVESIIAAAVVAVSILAVGTMVSRYSTMAKRAEAKQELPGVNTDVLNRARAVLLDTKNSSDARSTESICKLLVPEEVKPGVVPINVDLSRKMIEAAKWQAAFDPDWTISAMSADKTRITFTVTPKAGVNPLTESKSIDANSLSVQIKVIPRKLDPTGSSEHVFSDIQHSETLIDAKRVVFFLEAHTKYVEVDTNGQKTERNSVNKELISVIDIGGCDILSNGKWYTLSPAGTGSGDPSGTTIYNDTQYAKKGSAAFKFTFAKTEVTQGALNKGMLSADRTKNAVSACSETVYRCPKAGGQRRFRPYINVTAGVNYAPLNQYTNRKVTPVRGIPKLEFHDASDANILPANQSISYTFRPGIEYRKHTDGIYYAVGENGQIDLDSPFIFGENQTRVIATVNDAEPLCQNICGGTRPKMAKPFLSVESPDLYDPIKKGNVIESATADALSCTMCFVKGCGRMGLETFGPLEEMPPEPLDAQIPECSIVQTNHVNAFLPYNSESIANVTNDQCISARIVNDKLVYSTRNCAESLPVLCFAYGEYTFAQSLPGPHLVTSSHDGARAACRNLGREVQNVDVLKNGFSSQMADGSRLDTIPKIGNNYSFLNLAKVGSFVVPQSPEDQAFAIKTLKSLMADPKRSIGTVGEFWVALRTQSDHVIADLPRAVTTNRAEEQHAIFYDGQGRITYGHIPESVNDFVTGATSDSNRAFVLLNHAKYRGIIPAAKTQPSVLPFLCMRKSDKSFYISSTGSVNYNDGAGACGADGVFAAPTSPLAWLNALMMAEEHASFVPFSINRNTRKLWVALEGSESSPHPSMQGELADLGRKGPPSPGKTISSHNVGVNGAFVDREGLEIIKVKNPEYVPAAPAPALAPEPGETPVPGPTPSGPDVPEFIWIDNPNFKQKVACYNRNEKVITLRDLNAGCPSGQKHLYEADLKKPIYSLVWVLSKSNWRLNSNEAIKVTP